MHVALGCIDNALRLWHRVVVDHAWHDTTTCIVAHENGRTTGSDSIECSWHSPCETMTGLTEQFQLLRGAPVVDAVECRGFEQHVARAIMNFCFSSAHDT